MSFFGHHRLPHPLIVLAFNLAFYTVLHTTSARRHSPLLTASCCPFMGCIFSPPLRPFAVVAPSRRPHVVLRFSSPLVAFYFALPSSSSLLVLIYPLSSLSPPLVVLSLLSPVALVALSQLLSTSCRPLLAPPLLADDAASRRSLVVCDVQRPANIYRSNFTRRPHQNYELTIFFHIERSPPILSTNEGRHFLWQRACNENTIKDDGFGPLAVERSTSSTRKRFLVEVPRDGCRGPPYHTKTTPDGAQQDVQLRERMIRIHIS